jgi:hypothetical protein
MVCPQLRLDHEQMPNWSYQAQRAQQAAEPIPFSRISPPFFKVFKTLYYSIYYSIKTQI